MQRVNYCSKLWEGKRECRRKIQKGKFMQKRAEIYMNDSMTEEESDEAKSTAIKGERKKLKLGAIDLNFYGM